MPALLEKADLRKEALDPLRWFDRVRDELDQWLETSITRPPFLARTETMWMPPLEVIEREGEFFIAADLPGMNKDDVKLEVTPEGLTIRGERKSEKTEEGKGYFRSERTYGEFCRFVPLPEGALLDKVDARFKDGVLEIHVPVPKLEKKPVQTVAIK